MLVGFSGFVHSEVLLDHQSSLDWAIWTLEHAGGNLDELADVLLVGHTVVDLFLGWLLQVSDR